MESNKCYEIPPQDYSTLKKMLMWFVFSIIDWYGIIIRVALCMCVIWMELCLL